MSQAQCNAVQAAYMTQLVTGLLANNNRMHLYKNTFVPGPGSTLANFLANEASFTGYAAVVQAAGWTTGFDLAGLPVIRSLGISPFVQSASPTDDVVGGWFLTTSADALLIGHAPFDTPFAFNKVGNELLMTSTIMPFINADALSETIVGP